MFIERSLGCVIYELLNLKTAYPVNQSLLESTKSVLFSAILPKFDFLCFIFCLLKHVKVYKLLVLKNVGRKRR